MFYKVITADGIDTDLVDKIVLQTVDFVNTVFSYLFHDQHLEEPMLPTSADLTLYFHDGDDELYPISDANVLGNDNHNQTHYSSKYEQFIDVNLSSALSIAKFGDPDIEDVINRIAVTISYQIVCHYHMIGSLDLDDYYLSADNDY